MQVHADLMEDHLTHDPFSQFCSIRIGVGKELGVVEPRRIEPLPQIFELLVKLQRPRERLFGDTLVTVDDSACKLGKLRDANQWMEIRAIANLRHCQVAVCIADTIRKAEQEG